MTLVVGYASTDIGFLVSDSLLTPTLATSFEKGPVAGQFHGLKIQVLHPAIAIAYATSNDADAALGLIKGMAARIGGGQLENVPEHLFEAYKQAIESAGAEPPDCEFLALQVKPDGKKLAHITQRDVQNVTRGYIGDPDGYKKLTQLRKPQNPPKTQSVQQADGTMKITPLVTSEGENYFAEISDAMEDLVHQRRGSVGAIAGCIIRVVDARISKELEYLQAVEASVLPWEGISGFSLLASNSGTRGVGIYYRGGKLGYLLIVGDSEHVRKEYADTIKDFIEMGKSKFGLNLEGGTWPD
jgi:hypothetical protein